MVFHNKLNYGSTVYDAPTIPQVPKCVKRKRSTRKKHEEKKLSAFDLLATVAGEMLLEMNSHSNLKGNNNKENKNNNVRVKSEDLNLGSCTASTLHHESGYRRQVGSCTLSEPKVEKLNLKSEYTTEILDAMDLDIKPPALISFDSSMERPISKARSFPNFKNGFELDVDNDDDENSSGSTRSCSFGTITSKKYRENQASDSRVRKFLPSKFCKGSPSYDVMVSKPAVEGRMCYTRQRTKRSLFKRQKLYERRYIEGDEASGQKSLLESEECFVKFSIKSVRVPEIYIDIPETATVGSLKKTVMEAVSSIIDEGFKVGMVYEGKEVCDDTQTLFQAGIFHNKKIANLGFTLKPNSIQTPPSLTCKEDPKFITSSDFFHPCASTEAARKNPAEVSTIDEVPTPNKLTERALTLTLNSHDNEHDFVRTLSVEKADNSKAVVPVSSMTSGPLSVTPLQKSKRSELVQRRIRRPFSVAEVEALVHAVEKLGTGRWRDVKIRAFDNAKHRTYVDLKDKWKTLVHTATIAPQQRRGEPVPQELLDRVLSAQNYWSQQQAKFRLSSSLPGPCFMA